MKHEIVENGITYVVIEKPNGTIIKVAKGSPPPKTIFSKYEFRQRLTFDEKCALEEEAKTDVGIQVLIDDLMSASEIDINDDGFKLGMLYIHSKLPQTFSQSRINELSAPE